MKIAMLLPLLALAAPAIAADAPYYGPMKAWHGVGYSFGYKEAMQKDGAWRIVASTAFADPVDMALYRAADLAREQGFAYVELLGGRETGSPGYRSATLFARPSNAATPPATCPSRRVGTCYTASVAALLRRFGGVSGVQGGVAVVDHRDRYGRAVIVSGYGSGAAVPRVPVPVITPVPLAAYRPVANIPRRDPAIEADRALKAARPVRGDAHLGWSATD